MAARAGVEPTTLRLKAIDSTKAPPCHNRHHYAYGRCIGTALTHSIFYSGRQPRKLILCILTVASEVFLNANDHVSHCTQAVGLQSLIRRIHFTTLIAVQSSTRRIQSCKSNKQIWLCLGVRLSDSVAHTLLDQSVM